MISINAMKGLRHKRSEKIDCVIDKTFVSSMMEFDIHLVESHNLNMFSTIRLIRSRLNMSSLWYSNANRLGKLL